MPIFLLLGACSEEPIHTKTTPPISEDTLSYEECFPHLIDQFGGMYEDISSVPIAETCSGTSTQSFEQIEHVVFLGDSVTVGTYPTETDEFYRSLLTKKLAEYYNLQLPEEEWFLVDYNTGQTKIQRSGDFSSCAKLGSKTSDLLDGVQQLESCFTEDLRSNANILVIMTMGGNDLADIAQGLVGGWSDEQLWDKAEETVSDMEKGIAWLREQGRFSKDPKIIFGNIYEFTDATGDTSACPLAGMAGLDNDLGNPILEEMTIWVTMEYYKISRKYQSDMMFLLENFCGHGFHHDDPESRCYLGPDAELWFDNTCLHPNPTGHAVISDLLFQIIQQ